MDAVETAKMPKRMATNGGTGGCLGESICQGIIIDEIHQILWVVRDSGFPDVPDYFAEDILPLDWPKHPAVNALRVVADDIQSAIRVYILDALDQQSIARLAEGDHISGGGWNQ